jgi:hypothetical protein
VNLTCTEVRQTLNMANNTREIIDMLHIYAKDNLLWVYVYVKDSFATRIIRDEKMTRTNFVANVGGLLGLCMGFSLVSVAEIVYFCFKRKEPFWSCDDKSAISDAEEQKTTNSMINNEIL